MTPSHKTYICQNYKTLPSSKTSTSEAIEDSKPSNKQNKTLEKGKNYIKTFVRSNCIGYLQSINKEKTKIIKLLEIEENTDDDDEDVVFEIVTVSVLRSHAEHQE